MSGQVLRLFVSSPGDVPDERRRVDLVVERLNAEFEGRVSIETIRWETSYYSAHDTFQKQIPEAANCDVVVAVFRARLGTPLPAEFPHLPSGEPYPSGSAYEVLSAIEVRKAGKPLPDVYVFRYPTAPSVPLDAPDRADIETQWERLKSFFDNWFRNKSGEFVAAFQTYSSTDDFAVKVEDCLRQWLARRGFVPQGAVWDRLRQGSPFPGLSAFEVDRGSVFFGRDLAIAQAVERLREAGAGGKRVPFLLIIGASGSGKSSLLRAGLLPRLTMPGTIPEIDLWRTAIVTPGPDPFLSLAEGLFADAALGPELRRGTFRTKELLAKQLVGDVDTSLAPLRDALDKAAEERKANERFDAARPARLVLAIDQAERLFAEADAKSAAAFAELVAALVHQKLAYVIVILRSDVYARFQNIEALVGLREAGATFDLVPPTSAELEEIVTRPVAACVPRLAFEQKDGRSLAALLVADASGGDALPLLQMTLSRLYTAEAGRGDGLLRFADYRGMDAAVTETANEALDTLGDDARAELPALVTGLVTDVSADPLTGAAAPVVTALDRNAFEAPKAARQVLVEAFVSKRLLTAEGDGVHQRVRPVHEALLRIWPQAVAIVRENATLIRVRHTLEPMVREWVAASADAKSTHLEISPALLDGAQRLLTRLGHDLPQPMRDFITQAAAADAARRDRERHEQEERIRDAQELAAANRRIAQRTGIGLVGALLLVALAGWQWWVARTQTQIANTQTKVAQTQTDRAEKSAREADAQRDQAVQAGSRALAALADLRVNDGDAATGTLLALEAADQHAAPEVEAALVNGRLHLRELAVLPAQRNEVDTIAFSPDSQLAVTASSDEAEIWKADTGARFALLSGHRNTINDASFSPDSTRIATTSDDMTARVWDVKSAKTLIVLAGHTDGVTTVAFSPDGSRLVTASKDKTARVWDAASGKTIAVLSGHSGSVSSALFSPDGKLVLTTSKDNTARTWDATTGAEVAKFTGHTDEVWRGAFNADGKRVVTASLDTTGAVWESATGKLVTMLKGHEHRVFSAEFLGASNRVVTASYDQTARIWDGNTGATIAVLVGHHGAVMTAHPSVDGKYIATASTDGTARIWDADSGRVAAILSGHTHWVLNALISPNGRRVLTAGRDRTARLWADDAITISTGQAGSQYRLWRAALSQDGTRVAAPADGNNARIWDAQTGKVVVALKGHTSGINGAAFDPTGRRVLTTSGDRTTRIWDAVTGKTLVVLSGHEKAVVAGAFSADGKRVITGSVDATARIFDSRTGEQLLVLTGHEGAIAKVAFSPDGKRVITVSPFDRTTRLWDAATGKPVAGGIVKRGEVWGAGFSPDGKRIVATTVDVTILDAETGDFVATYPGFGERVDDAGYSPDGRYLLLASLDGTARIWNAENGRPISVLGGFSGGVWSIAVSADGRRLLTASGAQTLRISHMGLTAEGLMGDLKQAMPRCLTPGERAYFNLVPTAPEWCFGLNKWPYQSRAWKIWHRHKDDKDKPPQPDTGEWLPWVAKRGSEMRPKQPAESLEYLEEAASICKEYAENDSKNPRWRLALAANRIDEARALKALDRLGEAAAMLDTPLELLKELLAAEPNSVDRQMDVAYVYELLADTLLADHKRAEAIANYRHALPYREKLAAAEPDNTSRQSGVAYDEEKLAEELFTGGDKVESLSIARDNVAHRRKVAAAESGNNDRQENLAYGLRLLGDILLAGHNRPEAIAAFRESLAIRQKLMVAEPDNADRQNNAAFGDEHLGEAVLADGDAAAALGYFNDAIAIREKLAAAEPDDPKRQGGLVFVYEQLAEALQALGRHSDSQASYAHALAIREKTVARIERDEVAAKGKPGAATADKLASAAWVALFVGDYDKSLALSRRAVDLAPDVVWIKTNLAHALMFLNRTEEAQAMYLKFRGAKTFEPKIWEQTVLEDFAALRKAGLVNPLMDTIEKSFAAKS